MYRRTLAARSRIALFACSMLALVVSSACLPSDDTRTIVHGEDVGGADAAPDGDDAGDSPRDADAVLDGGGGDSPGASIPDAGTARDGSTDGDARGGSADADGGERPDQGGDSPEDCGVEERLCDGTCTNVLSNPEHCGGCGSSCGELGECVQGICQCGDEQIKCDGECVDPRSNDEHCFECGNACGSGMTCRKSVCIETDRKTAVVDKANEVRQTPTDCGQYGTKPAGPELTVDAELEEAAQAYAEKMAQHGFFAHEDPLDGSDFVERVNRTDYTGVALGENLARGLRQSAQRVVDGWESSEDHCRVMANPEATEVGIGLAEPESGTYDAYWVMLTGRR